MKTCYCMCLGTALQYANRIGNDNLDRQAKPTLELRGQSVSYRSTCQLAPHLPTGGLCYSKVLQLHALADGN